MFPDDDTLDDLSDDDLQRWLDTHDSTDDAIDNGDLLDRDAANRALRRLARLAGERERVRAVAAAMRQRADRYESERLAVLDGAVRFDEQRLEAWMRAQHLDGGPATVKLPYGTVGLRVAQPRVVVSDQEQAAKALVALGLDEAVETKHSVRANVVKQLVKDRDDVSLVRLASADGDGYEPHTLANADGEQSTGLVVMVPTRKSFSVTPA